MAGKRQPSDQRPAGVDNRWRYSGLGMELVGAVAGLTLVGYWIDRRFDSDPWGVLVGAAIGIVGGLWNLIWQGLRASQELSSEHRPDEHE